MMVTTEPIKQRGVWEGSRGTTVRKSLSKDVTFQLRLDSKSSSCKKTQSKGGLDGETEVLKH